MKKFFYFLLTALLCFLLIACGNTSFSNGFSNGVPDSLILREFQIDENQTYKINHDYDSATHIDDVELLITSKGNYGTKTTTFTCSYQYNKSTDLWTVYNEDNTTRNDIITLDAKKFIGTSFEGRFSQNHKGNYYIKVNALDLDNKTINITYTIIFDDGEILQDTREINIVSFNNETELGFIIGYKRSMVVMFELSFSLDLTKGISA